MQREHNQERRIDEAFHRAQAAYDAMLPPEQDDEYGKPIHICGDPNSPCDYDCMVNAARNATSEEYNTCIDDDIARNGVTPDGTVIDILDDEWVDANIPQE